MDVEDFTLHKDFIFVCDDPLIVCANPPSVTFGEIKILPHESPNAESWKRALQGENDNAYVKCKISWAEWYNTVESLLAKCTLVQKNIPPDRITFKMDRAVLNYLETVMEFFELYNETMKNLSRIYHHLHNMDVIRNLSEKKDYISNPVHYEKSLRNIHKAFKRLERRNFTAVFALSMAYRFGYLRTALWMQLMNESKNLNSKCAVSQQRLNTLLPKLHQSFQKLVQFRSFIGAMDTPEDIIQRPGNIPDDAAEDLVTLKLASEFHIFFLVINDWISLKVEKLQDQLEDIEDSHKKAKSGKPLSFYVDWKYAGKINNWDLDWFERDAEALQTILDRSRRSRSPSREIADP